VLIKWVANSILNLVVAHLIEVLVLLLPMTMMLLMMTMMLLLMMMMMLLMMTTYFSTVMITLVCLISI
jgi:hypothetical protein